MPIILILWENLSCHSCDKWRAFLFLRRRPNCNVKKQWSRFSIETNWLFFLSYFSTHWHTFVKNIKCLIGFNLTEISSLLFAPSLLDMKLPSCPQLCCGIILSCLKSHPCLSCFTFIKLKIIALCNRHYVLMIKWLFNM